ncbi:MAG: DUF1015 domain-containing protein [Myxococcaceae bacterium]|nr:DUF1015 domain-containing protein [Myxococcaceae bacterium]
MALLQPFRGLRPPKDLVQQIAAPPYDVMNRDEARAFSAGNEKSFFHVSRPEIEFGPDVDEHADVVYARGRENLNRFRQAGWLRMDEAPVFYVYRQKMGAHVQTGLVAAASVEEYDDGRIRKHELTRADKEDDRTRHIDALGANDEPVFLTYRADPAIDALIAEATRSTPEYDFTTEDGIGHTFWVLDRSMNPRIQRAFEKVPRLYIADGHHRSAAASRVRKLRRARGEAGAGHDGFLAVIFPHDQMQILDYNRVVKDLRGMTPEAFLARISGKFEIDDELPGKKPGALHHFGLYLQGRWRRLRPKPGTFPNTPVGGLDVSILQNNLLGPVLGIGDPRTDRRIHFVGGIRGTEELERLVDSGEYAVAFSMFPTSLEQLMAIADANEIMPPKSTWFEPKLRSGLVLHPFDAAPLGA